MMGRDADVVVVGAGVAGLAAALALGRMGLACLVIESRTRRGDVDRGDVLHSSSMALLSEWGCDDLVACSGGLTISKFEMVDEEGRPLIELDTRVDSNPSAQLFILRHPDIEALLESAAVRTGRVEVMRGVRCTSLTERSGRVTGAVSTSGAISGGLVLVATGTGSKLAQAYFGGTTARDYPTAFWNLECSGTTSAYRDRALYVLGRHGVMIVAPLPGDRLRLGFQTESSVGFDQNWPQEAGRRLRPLQGEPLEVVSAHRYPISRFLAPALSRPGAALLGDAAHSTHPAGAKGMNLAIQDAHVLAQSLKQGNLDSVSVDSALNAYSAARRPAVRRILRLTHALGVAGQFKSPMAIAVRNAALRRASGMRRVKSLLVSRICWNS